ncbi:hypothetical protein ACGFZZ_00725 [Streptomyces tendae]
MTSSETASASSGQLKKTFEDIENRQDDYRIRLIESIESVGKLVAGSKKA